MSETYIVISTRVSHPTGVMAFLQYHGTIPKDTWQAFESYSDAKAEYERLSEDPDTHTCSITVVLESTDYDPSSMMALQKQQLKHLESAMCDIARISQDMNVEWMDRLNFIQSISNSHMNKLVRSNLPRGE